MTDRLQPAAGPGLELESGSLRLALRPDLGGCIAGLWHAGVPVLLSQEPALLAGPRPSGGYALVPCSNRVAGSRFHWGGQAYSLRTNNGPSPHAIHGVGWERAWEVVSRMCEEAVIRLVHTADADWPFSFTATQRFLLSPAGLRIELEVLGTDARVQPVGLGWHPYFPRRPGSRLRLEVSHRWERGEDELPSSRQAVQPLDAAVEGLALDHCFEGWTGRAELRDERFATVLTSSLRRVVLFTPPDRPFFCVEPVSHVNNAVNSDDPLARGLLALAPGETARAWMQLDVSAA